MATPKKKEDIYARTILRGMDMYSKDTVMKMVDLALLSDQNLKEMLHLTEQKLPEEDFIKELKKIREEQVQ